MAASIRGVIELVTAILLGLVSVTTALGAYQASVWALEADDYRQVAVQMRDRNLTELLTAQLIFKQDGAKLTRAFTLESEAVLYPERADDIAQEQQALLSSASPGFYEQWVLWRDADFAEELTPLLQPEYETQLFSQPHSLQYSSFVANQLADAAGVKSAQVAVASVVFAIALLLLGVAGVNASWKVAATLAGSAALAYVGGLLFLLITVF